MNLFATTISFALLYVSAVLWIAQLLLIQKMRNLSLLFGIIAVPVITVFLVALVPGAYRLASVALLLTAGSLASAFARRRVLNATQIELFPKRERGNAILHVVMLTGSALFLLPLAWLVATSLKSDQQMNAFPPIWFPHPTLWRNYPDALALMPEGSDYGLLNLANTLVIGVLQVVGTLISSSLVAYSFARLRWPGRDFLFGVVLATMMLPGAVTMMPQFLIFRSLHWIDTLFPLWVPSFFASAFNIFLLRQFFMSIPRELEDASKIDGCGPFGTYWFVMIPMVKPALAAVAIMTFLGAWKDFMGPLIYISSPDKMPISYVLQLYSSAHGGEPGLLMAATVLVVLPVIILFFFTQRYFIEGVTLTGLGGR